MCREGVLAEGSRVKGVRVEQAACLPFRNAVVGAQGARTERSGVMLWI